MSNQHSAVPPNPHRLKVGKKCLITTDCWFVAPDGKEYKSVFGTVRAILSSEQSLGVKTNSKSTNWYVEIGNMLIAGCQIHYAFACDEVELGPTETYSENQGVCTVYERPSKIYDADGGLHE